MGKLYLEDHPRTCKALEDSHDSSTPPEGLAEKLEPGALNVHTLPNLEDHPLGLVSPHRHGLALRIKIG